MLRALSEYQVYGIKTTIPVFERILLHPRFSAGNYNTHFIAEMENELKRGDGEDRIAALIAAAIKTFRESRTGSKPAASKPGSHWKAQGRREVLSNRL
jgi:pyruvate carboxylase